jgi:glycosyltransferase involved in cell wall biosynthesis
MSGTATSPKRINLALVISNLTFGGAERQVVELANNIDKQTFDLHLFILSDHAPLADLLEDRDNRLRKIIKRHKFDITVISRLAAAFKALKIDVVHGFLYDAEIASRLAGRLAGCPVIIGSERNTSNNDGKIKRMIYRQTARLLDACIANSSAGAAFNRRVTGLPESAYHVIHNGVDTTRFQPHDQLSLRRELGLGEDQIIVGMFGSFKHQKNHPLLLQAASLICAKRSDVCFVFVGTTLHEGYKTTGSYAGEITQMVHDLKLDQFCHFLGAKRDVENYYNLCDITVLPSLFEGTPNVALESMACGVPVIATDVSDNRYVIPDGVAGHIVALGEPDSLAQCIDELADDDQKRARLGRQAREWVLETFSLQKMSASFGRVYRELLQNKTR